MVLPWEIRAGGALSLLREMEEASVQCVVTSPPYWGLRDYGTAAWEGGDPACEHKGRPKPRQDTSGSGPEKGRFAATRGTQPAKAVHSIPVRAVCPCGARRVDEQLGLEATPDEYVARVVEIFREVRRVLRKDGTLWLNLGDCYASSPCGNPDDASSSGLTSPGRGKDATTRASKRSTLAPGLKPKDLVMMPARVALALQGDGWWIRMDNIWAKPNPMPESTKDRPTKSHEYLFLMSRAERYYYDGEAIREGRTSDEDAVTFRGGCYVGGAIDNATMGHRKDHGNRRVPTGWDTGPGSHRTRAGRYRSGNKARTYGGGGGHAA